MTASATNTIKISETGFRSDVAPKFKPTVRACKNSVIGVMLRTELNNNFGRVCSVKLVFGIHLGSLIRKREWLRSL